LPARPFSSGAIEAVVVESTDGVMRGPGAGDAGATVAAAGSTRLVGLTEALGTAGTGGAAAGADGADVAGAGCGVVDVGATGADCVAGWDGAAVDGANGIVLSVAGASRWATRFSVMKAMATTLAPSRMARRWRLRKPSRGIGRASATRSAVAVSSCGGMAASGAAATGAGSAFFASGAFFGLATRPSSPPLAFFSGFAGEAGVAAGAGSGAVAATSDLAVCSRDSARPIAE